MNGQKLIFQQSFFHLDLPKAFDNFPSPQFTIISNIFDGFDPRPKFSKQIICFFLYPVLLLLALVQHILIGETYVPNAIKQILCYQICLAFSTYIKAYLIAFSRIKYYKCMTDGNADATSLLIQYTFCQHCGFFHCHSWCQVLSYF